MASAKLDLMAEYDARLAKMGVNPDCDNSDAPVALVHADAVPIVGNVHIPMGRVFKRTLVDRVFKRHNL